MDKLLRILVIVGAGLVVGTVAGKVIKSERIRSGRVDKIRNNEDPSNGKNLADGKSLPEEVEDYFI